jgi:hypothetical protein
MATLKVTVTPWEVVPEGKVILAVTVIVCPGFIELGRSSLYVNGLILDKPPVGIIFSVSRPGNVPVFVILNVTIA